MPQCYWLVEMHSFAKADLYYREGSPFHWTDAVHNATRFQSQGEADRMAGQFSKYQTDDHRIRAVQYPKPDTTTNMTWSI